MSATSANFCFRISSWHIGCHAGEVLWNTRNYPECLHGFFAMIALTRAPLKPPCEISSRRRKAHKVYETLQLLALILERLHEKKKRFFRLFL